MNENEDDQDEIKILDDEFVKNLYSHLGKKVGRGGQGCVKKVENFENNFIQNNDPFWAVKIFYGDIDDEKNFKRFVNEYKILNILNHPNIVKTYGFCNDKKNDTAFIMLEYCPHNLQEFKNDELNLNKIDLVGIIFEIVYAMKYVHSANLIHRDLKPPNILLDENNLVKICDFGLATLIRFDSETIKSRTCDAGTFDYIAPEIVNNEKYDEKVDIYSFGLVLYFLIKKDVPVVFERINRNKVDIPENANLLMKTLMEKCLSLNPNNNDFMLFDGIEDDIPSLKNKLGFSPIIEN